jgi:tetratricopeptide (TPR) repeat protein
MVIVSPYHQQRPEPEMTGLTSHDRKSPQALPRMTNCPAQITRLSSSQRIRALTTLSLLLLSILFGLKQLAAQTPTPKPESQDAQRGVKLNAAAASGSLDALRQHKDYALLFATNQYDDENWKALVNPIPDAEAIAKELQDTYGFEAVVVRNPTRKEIFRRLLEYGQKKYGDGDQLLIFFAGHGLYDEATKQGYLVSRDSRFSDEVKETYESYADLQGRIDAIQVRHLLLVLDACFGGTFNQRSGTGGARGDPYANSSLEELFTREAKYKTRRYLTSGGKDYVADGVPGHHSPFAANFLNALRSEEGSNRYLTLPNIESEVEKSKQQPYAGHWGDDEPGGGFLFISKPYLASVLTHNPSKPHLDPPPPAVMPAKDRHSIAVFGFQNLSGKAADQSVSVSLSEWLSTELSAGEKLRTFSGEEVARARNDLALPQASGYSKESLARLAKNIPADYVVSGSFLPIGNTADGMMRADFRLQNAHTAEQIDATSEKGSLAELSDLVKRVGTRFREKLGVQPVSDDDARTLRGSLTKNTRAIQLYSDGLQKLRAYDLPAARDLLEKAVQADPEFAKAHAALATSWSELGYDSKAIDEAKKAFDLSTNLPLKERFIAEATYRQMNSEWDRAIEIFRDLRNYYKDETDYAFALAKVQTDAQRGNEAIATLADFRNANNDAAGDPRLDYLEAVANESLSQAVPQHKAAAKAAARATQIGARLLAAQANWLDCAALLALADQTAADLACRQAREGELLPGGQKVMARGLTALANVRFQQGNRSEEKEFRQQALDTARRIGSRKDTAGALFLLGNIFADEGKNDEARRDFAEAIEVATEIGDRQQLLNAQFSMASLYQTEGQNDAALRLYAQALQTARDIKNNKGIADGLRATGVISLQQGELAAAQRNLEESVKVARDSGMKDTMAAGLVNFGDLLMTRNDLAGARKNYELASNTFQSLNDAADAPSANLALAILALEDGKTNDSENLARQTAAAFADLKQIDPEVDARNATVRALLAQGKIADAQAEMDTAEKLAVQDAGSRVALKITGDRLKSLSGKSAEAKRDLEERLEEVKRQRRLDLQFEIRLALAEIEAAFDKKLARAISQKIATDAREQGFLLVAAKAAR